MIFLFDEFVKFINPSHLNISMQILHTVSYTGNLVLTTGLKT